MVCFNLEGGANITDYDVYRGNSMCGGLGYSEFKLKTILKQHFEIIEFRNMIESFDEKVYGFPTLWTILMKKKQVGS